MKKSAVVIATTFAVLLFAAMPAVAASNSAGRDLERTVPPVRPSSEPSFVLPKGTPVTVQTPNGGKSCQAILTNIKTRSENLTKSVNSILIRFDAILLSVQNYYTGTVVPSGKTVANYQSMINDIQTKRAAVSTALAAAKADLSTLTCDGGNPRDLVSKYNKDMRTVKSALIAYRSSIQNLIRAVHGFQKSIRPSFSPRATFLPRGSGKPTPNTSARPYFSPKPVRSIGPAVDPFQ